MIQSHALLYCPSEKPWGARKEVWEGKNLRSIRVLLSNSRWEHRLIKFLELSGVGRVVEDGRDEDQAWAEKMDGWMAWETEERAT